MIRRKGLLWFLGFWGVVVLLCKGAPLPTAC